MDIIPSMKMRGSACSVRVCGSICVKSVWYRRDEADRRLLDFPPILLTSTATCKGKANLRVFASTPRGHTYRI